VSSDEVFGSPTTAEAVDEAATAVLDAPPSITQSEGTDP
jgi:hypothetical protein